MTAAGGPVLGSRGPTLGSDDFSLYSYLSDEEQIQLAIERSLAESENATSATENTKNLVPLHRTTPSRAVRRPTPQADPPPCPANPPKYKPAFRNDVMQQNKHLGLGCSFKPNFALMITEQKNIKSHSLSPPFPS